MTTPSDPTPHDPTAAPEALPATSDAGQPPVDLSKPTGVGGAAASTSSRDEPAPDHGYGPGQPDAGVPAPAAQPYAGQPYPGQQHSAQPYPGQPYPAQPYPGQPYPPAYVYPKNQLGVWSLVLGIVGVVVGCVFVTGIPAVILGNNAKRAVAAGEANNLGMAQAGIVLGWISIALGVVAVGFFVLYLVGMAGVLGLSFLSTGSGY